MAAVVALGALSGCTSAQGDDIKKVSVVQIVSHPSLDTIRDSFSDEMEQLGYTEGEIELEYYDAGNDTSTLDSILSTASGDGSDVIVAIATYLRRYPIRSEQVLPLH